MGFAGLPGAEFIALEARRMREQKNPPLPQFIEFRLVAIGGETIANICRYFGFF